MKQSEMIQYVGKTANYTTDNGLSVNVIITDAKATYGTPRVEITPETGSGRAWVNVSSLSRIR